MTRTGARDTIPVGTICKVIAADKRPSETKSILALVRVGERPDYLKGAPAEHVYCSTVTRWPSLIQQCGMIDPAEKSVQFVPLTGRNKWEREVLADVERAEKRADEQAMTQYRLAKLQQTVRATP